MNTMTKTVLLGWIWGMAAIMGSSAWAGNTGGSRPPSCLVTERTRPAGPYTDNEEVVSRREIELRWVSGDLAQYSARAEADLPDGGKAVLEVGPGYGMIFYKLQVQAADGRSANVQTMTPWFKLSTGASHTDWTLKFSSVSTSLELSDRVTANCHFNPLLVKRAR